MIYFFSVTMHMEDVIPLEATGLLFVILKSLFSLFLTWNHSQIQFGVSCQKFNGIIIPGNNKKQLEKALSTPRFAKLWVLGKKTFRHLPCPRSFHSSFKISKISYTLHTKSYTAQSKMNGKQVKFWSSSDGDVAQRIHSELHMLTMAFRTERAGEGMIPWNTY